MEQRQTYALLISGDELRFIHSISTFQQFLLNEVGIPRDRIRLVSYHESKNYAIDEIGDFFRTLPKDMLADVVIVYNGHGLEGKFFPNGQELRYKDFGRLIAKLIPNTADYIFLNDSCYSGSCVPPFADVGLLPRRGMILASNSADKKSDYDVFVQRVMDTYRKRRPFTKRVVGMLVIEMGEFMKPHLIVDKSGQENIVFPYHPTSDRMVLGSIQHPVRAGKSLDHLLFSKR